jgi:predicted PurR-regulated permease PerM
MKSERLKKYNNEKIMRFILNFIFFGILFYLIWLYFPDAFQTLVSWANHTVAFFRDLMNSAIERFHQSTPTPTVPQSVVTIQNWFIS